MNRVVAVIQARMQSTRLPGKVLKTILGRPVLWYVIQRVSQARCVDLVVVATSTQPGDDQIAEFCESMGIHIYRGSEDDVLRRYYEAATEFRADPIMRITADCPLVDPGQLDKLIAYFDSQKPDHCGIGQSFPDGFNAEIFTYSALRNAFQEARKPSEREHVTSYLKAHPGIFRVIPFEFDLSPAELGFPHLEKLNHLLLSLDEPYDFEVLSAIISQLYPGRPDFSVYDVLQLVVAKKCPTPRTDVRGSAVGYVKSLSEDRPFGISSISGDTS